MDDRNQHNPHGFLPDLGRFSSAPYPSLPRYHPGLFVHPWPDSNQPPLPTFTDPFSGINHVVTDGIPFVASMATPPSGIYGRNSESGVIGFQLGGLGDVGSGGSSRWPRQETLTLLEIRSRLADNFRESNQKGPLWDEVSRIMSEKYGYQRTGKKCREKFENLHKYYKKTKEGKAGRHDGKNYRFFRQLESIYSGSSVVADLQDVGSRYDHLPLDLGNAYRVPTFNVERENRSEPQPSFSNSMSVDYHRHGISSEEEDNVGGGEGELSAVAFVMAEKGKMRMSDVSEGQASKMSASSGGSDRISKGWKAEVKEFVDEQVTRIMEKQADWMEKMLRTIESNEQDRVRREMEWREREAAKFERERESWAKERAWMEARDVAFVDSMRKKFKGKEAANDYSLSSVRWQEHEILSLIQVVTSMEQRRQPGLNESGHIGEGFWASVEAKMASLGYHRNASGCRDKWYNISDAFRKITEADRNSGRGFN